jgi:hypothetical protein
MTVTANSEQTFSSTKGLGVKEMIRDLHSYCTHCNAARFRLCAVSDEAAICRIVHVIGI